MYIYISLLLLLLLLLLIWIVFTSKVCPATKHSALQLPPKIFKRRKRVGIWQVARHCKPMRTSGITSPMRLAWSSSHSGAHGPSALFAKWVILWVKLKAWTLAGSDCRTYDHLWPTSCLGSFMNQAFDHDDAPNPTQPKSFARVERWNSTLCTCIQRHQREPLDVHPYPTRIYHVFPMAVALTDPESDHLVG
jgi:hypothetical protein